jgi:hypothetical protein
MNGNRTVFRGDFTSDVSSLLAQHEDRRISLAVSKKSVRMPVLRGIVKDDPKRMSVSLTKFANSMAKGHTIVATGAFVGPLIDGEHNGVALSKWHYLRARLHARPLLSQHKFSALEIRSWF